MYKDLKEALKEPTQHLKYDVKLMKAIQQFRISWMQKAPEYLDFLGGKLLGVHPVRFSTRDDELLFVDILDLDMDNIKNRIHRTKGINKSWNVSSNPYYNVLMFLMHKFYTSRDIKKELKNEVVTELFIIYYYKIIGSLLSKYFGFNASENIAKGTIERLSNKSLIKKLDSWQDVIVFRAKDVLPKGLHYDKLIKYSTDGVIYTITDTQGRIRDIIKSIYVVMLEVIDDDTRIHSTSLIKESEDGVTVSDITERPDKYIQYMRGIVDNSTELVDIEIIKLICKVGTNSDPASVRNVLVNMSDEKAFVSHKLDIVEYVIINSIEYLRGRDIYNDYLNNITSVIKILKGYWTAGSINYKEHKEFKKYIFNLTKKYGATTTKWKLVSHSTTIMIYLFIRAIVGKR